MARAATVSQGAGLSGLEFGLAIPGTAGGAVWANAGAHESNTAAVLERPASWPPTGARAQLSAAELGLGYRDSRLKHPAPGGPVEVVLGATFRLSPAAPDEIKERLEDDPPLAPGAPAAGHPERRLVVPQPAAGDSAGELIERAGLEGPPDGRRVGQPEARQLPGQRPEGTAADLRRLAERVRAEVLARTGIRLEEEVVFLGDWGELGEPAGGPSAVAR